MKIRITKILDPGVTENERVLFEVLEDCNLGDYLIAYSKVITESSISISLEELRWLNDSNLLQGDTVVIYTNRKGKGVQQIKNTSGSTSHFLFWNLDSVIGSRDDIKVVLFETKWTTFSPEHPKDISSQ